MRNKWKKPELIVLVRSRPEENVLDFCKTGGSGHINPSDSHVGCMVGEGYQSSDCDLKGTGTDPNKCYKCCGSQST